MENLHNIAKLANEILKSQTFIVNDDYIMNIDNRYEGNDINMSEEDNFFELRISGITQAYETIEDAAQGLIDTYDPEIVQGRHLFL